MKITETYLKKVIKEELEALQNEESYGYPSEEELNIPQARESVRKAFAEIYSKEPEALDEFVRIFMDEPDPLMYSILWDMYEVEEGSKKYSRLEQFFQPIYDFLKKKYP